MRIEFKPVLVQTRNVRATWAMMDALNLAAGEGRMGIIHGRPGIGKSYTSVAFHAQNDGVYLRIASIWKRSELDFIQALCRELGVHNPPPRKGACYREAVQRLVGTNRPVFLDEMQRLSKEFLNIALDLSDATGCPFVLVGEPELKSMMETNARVWSRTFQAVEFTPITIPDVMMYAAQGANLKLPPAIATIIHQASGGDFREVRRSMLALIHYMNAQGPGPDGEVRITEEMAKLAAQTGLKGGNNGHGKISAAAL